MSTNAIVPTSNTIIRSMDDAERAAGAMAASGYFQDSRNAAQAVVKILAGQELGFGPFASMKGVYIIQGGPSLSANLMAAAVKKSGRYNYRVAEMTDKTCSIKFFEDGEEIGVSTFTAEDARKAGTKNMDKFPRNMLFARAMSNGCRWYCPDVFNGNTVYTPEELGATVNEEGEVIDVTPSPAHTSEEPATTTKQEVTAFDHDAVTKLAADYGQAINRIQNALAYCNYTKPSDYETLAAWMTIYREGRDKKMTPAEAGEWANTSRGTIQL